MSHRIHVLQICSLWTTTQGKDPTFQPALCHDSRWPAEAPSPHTRTSRGVGGPGAPHSPRRRGTVDRGGCTQKRRVWGWP